MSSVDSACGRLPRRHGQLGRVDHAVQEPGLDRVGRGELFGQRGGPVEAAGVSRWRRISMAVYGSVSPIATSLATSLYGPAAPIR